MLLAKQGGKNIAKENIKALLGDSEATQARFLSQAVSAQSLASRAYGAFFLVF